eukprot:355152-Chlamydomonas_euryale.AAC.5
MPKGTRVHRGAFAPLALSSNAVRRQPRGLSLTHRPQLHQQRDNSTRLRAHLPVGAGYPQAGAARTRVGGKEPPRCSSLGRLGLAGLGPGYRPWAAPSG